jgi:hypothetical protein
MDFLFPHPWNHAVVFSNDQGGLVSLTLSTLARTAASVQIGFDAKNRSLRSGSACSDSHEVGASGNKREVRIAEGRLVEHVEHFSTKLQVEALGEFGVFHH